MNAIIHDFTVDPQGVTTLVPSPKPMTLKAAREIAGSTSCRNTKMPGGSFAVSAFACKVGDKLAKIEGSTCHKCYARKLENMRPSVAQGWTANTRKAVDLIARDPDQWVAAMVKQVERDARVTGQPYFRWFDSGDLQSVEMLSAICQVAVMTPDVRHWLPTREAGMVKRYRKAGGYVPSNLIIRVSATMVDDAPIAAHEHTSTVHRKGSQPHGHACPANRTHAAPDGSFEVIPPETFKALKRSEKSAYDLGHCGNCRACWSAEVPNVSYGLH